MNAAFSALIISFIVSCLFIPVIIKVAASKRLYDEPDERKIHTRKISSLGGIGIFAGFIFACLSAFPFTPASGGQYIITAALILFFLGLKDDLMVMEPLPKLLGQVAAAAVLVLLGGLRIENMHGFLGGDVLPVWLGSLMAIGLVVFLINACNLIDGIDGLAGMLGLIVSSLLGVYFLFCGQYADAVISLALVGAICGFLLYNMEPAKIFMGDGGSMLIGMVVSVVLIRFINYAPTSEVFSIAAAPEVGFSLVVIPLMDTIRVFTIRLIQGRSPFRPDKNHLHHLLLKRNLSHKKIVLLLGAASLAFVLLALCLSTVSVHLAFLTISTIFFLAMGMLTRFWPTAELLSKPKSKIAPIATTKTVVPGPVAAIRENFN